ncbi:MAG TPA: hypothetical protein VEC12_01805 [Bacteroidia bacterium]|nr:hypothetical protein [Bacteroidia bacterium]
MQNRLLIPAGYVLVLLILLFTSCELMPRNTLKDCRSQCPDTNNPDACYDFCDCIHKQGRPLDSCLEEYERVNN